VTLKLFVFAILPVVFLLQGTGPDGATVGGTVIDADGSPIRASMVELAETGDTVAKSMSTNANGQFLFRQVARGRYNLAARKAGYLPGSLGAVRWTGAGAILNVTSNDTLTNVQIRLVRSASLEGIVSTESGQPAAGVEVWAFKQGAIFPSIRVKTQTDDRGRYRLFDLPPGQYALMSAVARSFGGPVPLTAIADIDATLATLSNRSNQRTVSEASKPQPVAIGPVFYPGVSDPSQTVLISIQAGDQLQGLDLVLRRTQSVSVAGRLPGAGPGQRISLTLSRQTAKVTGPDVDNDYNILAAREGTFEFPNVAPGRYRLEARSIPAVPGTPLRADTWARTDLEVNSSGLRDVILTLQPAIQLRGKLVTTFAETPNGWDPGTVEVSLIRRSALKTDRFGRPVVTSDSPTIRVGRDGSFVFESVVPDVYVVSTRVRRSDVFVASAMLGAQEGLDVDLIVRDSPDQQLALTVTNRRQVLSGKVIVPSGYDVASYRVLVFPAARELWRPTGRRMAVAPVDQAGQYEASGLPPGEYLVGAFVDLGPDDLGDPQLLDRFAAQCYRVRLLDRDERFDIQIKEIR